MKRAILVASYGVSNTEVLKCTIEVIEKEIQEAFQDYSVFRAFTSKIIISKLEKTKGLKILNLEEALEALCESKYEEVIIQPLHMIAGLEYEHIISVAREFEKRFHSIKVGTPILSFRMNNVSKSNIEDYSLFIKSIEEILKENRNVVFFGHGTTHIANSSYGILQEVLDSKGYNNVVVGTLGATPGFEEVLSRLKKSQVEEVLLMPLMVVAGEHALKDMASDKEDSWKSMLIRNGIRVNILQRGLGEREAFRRLYINKISNIISQDTVRN